MTLNKTATGALNQVFKVKAFTPGFPIATAKVIAALDGSNDDHDDD